MPVIFEELNKQNGEKALQKQGLAGTG